jgi:probable F420-dependent oxidoreductase
MVAVSLGLNRLHELVGADHHRYLEVARRADARGIDQLSTHDHVVMSADALANYPYGKYPEAIDAPLYEPVALLAAIAAQTRRIRLSMNVMVAPVRPAVVLAKQLATLDVLSDGRLDAGIGVGWQREELEACGVPYERRYTLFEEQIEVCRLLWRQAPADYEGKTIRFRNLHAWPRPVQPAGVPLWLGLAATDRGAERIARLGDGWLPPSMEPRLIRDGLAVLHRAMAARGRDPASLQVRAALMPHRREDGAVDLDATFAAAPALVAAGATVIEAVPAFLCRHPDEIEDILDRLVTLKAVL